MFGGATASPRPVARSAKAAEARAARDEAIDRVDRGAGLDWMEDAGAVIRRVASERPEFTSDDVWEAGLAPPHEPRALGAAMVRAIKLGICEGVDTWARIVMSPPLGADEEEDGGW